GVEDGDGASLRRQGRSEGASHRALSDAALPRSHSDAVAHPGEGARDPVPLLEHLAQNVGTTITDNFVVRLHPTERTLNLHGEYAGRRDSGLGRARGPEGWDPHALSRPTKEVIH